MYCVCCVELYTLTLRLSVHCVRTRRAESTALLSIGTACVLVVVDVVGSWQVRPHTVGSQIERDYAHAFVVSSESIDTEL